MAQVCFEFSLLSCYIFILLAVDRGPLAWQPDDQLPCIIAVAGLQFLYMAAFMFLLLESLVILRVLLNITILSTLEHVSFVVIVGVGLPLLFTTITFSLHYQDLVPHSQVV